MYLEETKEFSHNIEKYGHSHEWLYHSFINGADDADNHVRFALRLKSNVGQFDPEEGADPITGSVARYAGPVAE